MHSKTQFYSNKHLLAEHFYATWTACPRYFKGDDKKSWDIDEFIEDNSISAVLLMSSGKNINKKNLKALGM